MDVSLIDLHGGGHHRSYLEMLSEFWSHRVPEGVLRIFVSPSFLEVHHDFASGLDGRIELHSLDLPGIPSVGSTSRRDLVRLNRAYTAALKQVSSSARGAILLPYFDHAVLAMARFRGAPKSVSGIYFRDPFREEAASGLRNVRGAARRFALRGAVRNRALHRLFCLDPTIVGQVDSLALRQVSVALPDGVRVAPPSMTRDAQRALLGADDSTRVLLFFGVASRRKGIIELSKSIPAMDAEHRDRTLLVVAGPRREGEREVVEVALGALRDSVRVVEIDGYVRDGDVASLFVASDVVLVPYTSQHRGSSGVLVRAATYGRPVIGPDRGLVAEQIAHHHLGQAVDTQESGQLARALEAAVDDPSTGFNHEAALAFGRANSAERFAETIFAEMGCELE